MWCRTPAPSLFIAYDAIFVAIEKTLVVGRKTSAWATVNEYDGNAVWITTLLEVQRMPTSHVNKSIFIVGYVWVKSFHFISARCASACFGLLYCYKDLRVRNLLCFLQCVFFITYYTCAFIKHLNCSKAITLH